MRKIKLFLSIFYFLHLFQNIFPIEHIVQKGETVWSISKNYHIKTDDILKINEMIENNLLSGQKLKIPDSIMDYPVKRGQNLTKVAEENSSEVQIIIIYNNLATEMIREGQVLKIPVFKNPSMNLEKSKEKPLVKDKDIFVYKIKKGDTLGSICKYYQVSVEVVMKYNKKKNSQIFAGEKLMIPRREQSIQALEQDFVVYENRNFPIEKNNIQSVHISGRGVAVYLFTPCVVQSIKSGVVEYIGELKSYKNVAIVRYQGEERAIYGFLNRIAVKQGDKIKQGQPIGYADKISFLGHVELYFELRRGKKNLDILDIYPFLKSPQYLAKK
jgi:LysM repeat protein